MQIDAPGFSVEDLNTALRLYRRLLLRMMLIVLCGFVGAVLLSKLGSALSPPAGVSILGQGLGSWGLLATLLLLLGELWLDGHAIGKALNDPLLKSLPPLGIMSGMTLIAQRAVALGMEWSGLLGPLRPAKRR